jgi:2-succinyl-5-enolpyruvyl-6-hydroxy-3-cyclohexene-1-carboxylate synthase
LIPVRDDLSYEANRGTSGIDGSVSTAVGAALVSDQLHLLVVGDLSFVYDSNSLWNKNFPGNLRIIVLNDGGGSIFRLLEGPGRMDFFEEFSVTHHPVSIELLAQAFGRRFARVSGTDELREHLEALMKPESALSVLEVDTTASENSHIFTSFFQKIRS